MQLGRSESLCLARVQRDISNGENLLWEGSGKGNDRAGGRRHWNRLSDSQRFWWTRVAISAHVPKYITPDQ